MGVCVGVCVYETESFQAIPCSKICSWKERIGHRGFPGVKNSPAMQEPQETWVLSLGQQDPLGEDMATQSSILAWRILWTEEPGGLWSRGLQRVGHD